MRLTVQLSLLQVVSLVAVATAALPPPLPLVCLATAQRGCFNDSFTPRTFPVQRNNGPGDAFYDNSTLETCAYLCATAPAPGPYPVAAVENGGQCFCGTPADLAAALAHNRTADADCSAPCNGFPLATCGGAWRLQAYEYACAPYDPGAAAWQNASLPVGARVDDLVARLGDLQLIAQLTQNGADVYARGVQLPRYIVSQECLAGFDGGDIYIAPPVPHTASSGFPQPVNLGNSFDAELVRELASAISDEARAAFTHLGRPSLTCMSPNLNVNRDPRWGRNIESFGEEPALIATLGAAYVTGIQAGTAADAPAAASGFLKVMAVPKHLGAYSLECYNASGGDNPYPAGCTPYRNTFNAVVDEVDLRETYFPGWAASVSEARASGVMCSYNEINGVPACVNGDVLQAALVGDWGLEGFVISDADAVALTGWVPDQAPTGGHNYTASLLDSAVAALVGGTTISLEDTDPQSAAYAQALPRALALGRVTRAQLEAAARRALTPRFRVGLYDPPAAVPWSSIPASVVESEAHHALARRAAAESYVLLQNAGGLLPLLDPAQGGPATIAVVGASADCADCSVNRYSGHPNRTVSFFAGVRDAAAARGAAAVLSADYGAAATAAVRAADVAVVVLTSQSEGESEDRMHIGLPADQVAFLAGLHAAGVTTPVVAVVASGGAVDSSPALAAAGAVLAVYMGGMEAGSALADVLYGVVNPSGALAATVYRSSWEAASDFLSMSVRAPPGRGRRYLTPAAAAEHVLFPFGFGLSYTSWAAVIEPLAPASVSVAALTAGANVTVTVAVTNTGALAGARVAFVLLSRVGADPAEQWPAAWLPRAGFAKLHGVAPGAVARATLSVGARDVARWDAAAHAFTVRAGTYSLAARDAAPGAEATLVVTP